MCLYSVGWTLSYLITLGIWENDRFAISYTFLTNWGDVTNSLYFTFSAALAFVGVMNRRKMIFTENVATKLLRSVTWMLFTAASCAQIVITITYWVVLAPTKPPADLPTPFNIHRHAINLVLIFMDIWVTAFPVRILHFIYGSAFAFVYIFMTVLEWATGGIDAVYFFLNWETNPGLAVGIAIAFAIFGPLLCQIIWFGIYSLRVYTSTLLVEEATAHGSKSHHTDIDNPAFEENE